MRWMLLFIGLTMLFGCTGQQAQAAPAAGAGSEYVSAQADSVLIALSDMSSTVKHYEYESGGVKVRYFAVKGSDGVVRTAFDACEVCYGSHKGYSQVGDSVMCNNCGLKFRIDDLGTKNRGSGCWPAYLPNEIKGEHVVIKKSDLESGRYLFG